MKLSDYFHILRRRWLTLLVVMLAVVVLGGALTAVQTPQYTSTVRMFFAVASGNEISDISEGSSFTESQISSYAEVATSTLVLAPIVAELNLDLSVADLRKQVDATPISGTSILDLAATHPDPALAQAIAEDISTSLIAAVRELWPVGAAPVQATVLDAAERPLQPSSPRVALNLATAVIAGLVLGASAAFLRDALDSRMKDPQSVAKVTDLALLATIPRLPRSANGSLFFEQAPYGPQAEALRKLRTNLEFFSVDHKLRSLVVTSSLPCEGKTVTSANLALALADTGRRTLLVDTDLRRPAVAKLFGLEGAAGVTSILIGHAEPEDVIQPLESSLSVLAAGPIPPNPSELLASERMRSLVARLESTYDYVILDSSPLLPVTDAARLAQFASGTLLVIGARTARAQHLTEALRSLATSGASVFGIVLNSTKSNLAPSRYRSPITYAPVLDLE